MMQRAKLLFALMSSTALIAGCTASCFVRPSLPDGSDAILDDTLIGDWARPGDFERTFSLRRKDSRSKDYILTEEVLGVFPNRGVTEPVRLIRLGGALFLDVPQFPPAKGWPSGVPRIAYPPVRLRRRGNRLFVDQLNEKFIQARTTSLPNKVGPDNLNPKEVLVLITASRAQLRRFLAANAQNEAAWVTMLVLERRRPMPNGPDAFATPR